MRKYRIMDSDDRRDDDGGSVLRSFHENGSRNKKSSSYVMACAIFASFNSVLLGYGWCIFSSFPLYCWEEIDDVESWSDSILHVLILGLVLCCCVVNRSAFRVLASKDYIFLLPMLEFCKILFIQTMHLIRFSFVTIFKEMKSFIWA